MTKAKGRWRSWALLVALLLFALWFVGTGAYPFLMSSELNCCCEDVDINTGRYRYQRYVLWQQVSERIDETFLSQLYRKHLGEYPHPEWRRVSKFSPVDRYSPYYTYHGALSQISLLETLFSYWEITPEAEKEVVQTVLRLWQKHWDADLAGEYIWALDDTIGIAPTGPVEIKHLPDPEKLEHR